MKPHSPVSSPWKEFLDMEARKIIADIGRRLPPRDAHEAEDITYRSVEEVAGMEEVIQDPLKLKNVIYQRAKWRLIDFMRRKRTQEKGRMGWYHKEEAREQVLMRGSGYHKEFLKEDFWNCWNAALEHLGPRDRELVARRHLHGESRSSLARHYGMAPGTVATRICRGMKKVREVLEANGVGPDYFFC